MRSFYRIYVASVACLAGLCLLSAQTVPKVWECNVRSVLSSASWASRKESDKAPFSNRAARVWPSMPMVRRHGQNRRYCQSAESVLRSISMKTLTVKLPDPLFAEIAHDARARRISKSEIVRERLGRSRTSTKSLWSRMEDLVIEQDSLPKDLSSNKKYMRNLDVR